MAALAILHAAEPWFVPAFAITATVIGIGWPLGHHLFGRA